MNEDRSNGELLTLLGDTHTQAVLRATASRPVSASTLTDMCNASRATVYRRIDDLLAYDLLTEGMEIDDDGNHYKVYEANLDRITVQLVDGEFDVRVRRREDAAERITRIWDELRGGDR